MTLARNRFRDHDTSPDARKARYIEYLGLKCLPWLNREQARRISRLRRLRIRDNKTAFNNRNTITA